MSQSAGPQKSYSTFVLSTKCPFKGKLLPCRWMWHEFPHKGCCFGGRIDILGTPKADTRTEAAESSRELLPKTWEKKPYQTTKIKWAFLRFIYSCGRLFSSQVLLWTDDLLLLFFFCIHVYMWTIVDRYFIPNFTFAFAFVIRCPLTHQNLQGILSLSKNLQGGKQKIISIRPNLFPRIFSFPRRWNIRERIRSNPST